MPDTTSLNDQLNAFLKRKAHIALVVDEYGEVQGLVTLEDILEEIVGDIADEHDIDRRRACARSRTARSMSTARCRSATSTASMDWDLPDEEATTVAGLVIHEARIIPEPGQAFTFHGFRFQVLRKNRNRITALRITPLDRIKPPPAPAPTVAAATPRNSAAIGGISCASTLHASGGDPCNSIS